MDAIYHTGETIVQRLLAKEHLQSNLLRKSDVGKKIRDLASLNNFIFQWTVK
jgi:hypothetical protein